MTQAADALALRARVARYYTGTLAEHGPTPRGVDWSCRPTQELRFVQLLRLCDFREAFSLNDVGCGYGALLGFIRRRHPEAQVDYHGTDLSEDMVNEARRLLARQPRRRHAQFSVADACPRSADYSVASGIFNVRLDESEAAWEEFVRDTLRAMASSSRRGFAVNFLASLPAGVAGIPQLYRTTPAEWVAWCERSLGGQVTALDRYGMREFTLLVRA